MKKKTALILVSAAAVCAIGAYAAGGSASDPLITKAYLNDTYLTQITSAIQSRVSTDTKSAYQEAADKLDALGNSKLGTTDASDWSYADSFALKSVTRGGSVTVKAGSSVMVAEGRCTSSAILIDATAGKAASAGSVLTPGHRYINGADETTSVAVTAVSDAAVIAAEGYWTEKAGSSDVTAFTDVASSDWYYSAVRYAVDQGLFSGLTATTFAANGQMTRAMLSVVLYRMENSPGVTYSALFNDVAEGKWYSNGIIWAAQSGIVSGVGDGKFNLNGSVTREQIAAMLYRYAGDYLKTDVSRTGDLSAYPDSGKVSSYAKDAMSWAVGSGIITGSDGKLLPKSNATRAQVAVMLQRFNETFS